MEHDVSATGAAGLAGLMEIRGQIAANESIAVLFTGARK
jgi:hypothetical protein